MKICADCKHVFERELEYGDAVLVFEDCPFCGSSDVRIAGDVLQPDENSGRGKAFEPEHDVARKQQYPLHYRLARGFALLSGNKHES